MNLRRLRRSVAVAWVLTMCLVRLLPLRLRGKTKPMDRALWLQDCCRRVLGCMGVQTQVIGQPPNGGVLVSNHLSYLDILAYSSVMPCIFIAKIEISRWPYFGFVARQAGCVFVDRSSRTSAQVTAKTMQERLADGIPFVVFAEGGTTDGSSVTPFRSPLFEPAVAAGAPVTAAAVRYRLHNTGTERELCWLEDETLLPHLWRTLKHPMFDAEVRFGTPRTYTDRRIAAQETHAEVIAMREEWKLAPVEAS